MYKQKFIALLFLATMFLFSCDTTKNDQSLDAYAAPATTYMSPDSLMKSWNDAWNNDDSIALRNMFTDKSLVISNELQLTGTDSIMKGWINQNMPALLHLSTTTLQSGTSDSVVFNSGTWKGLLNMEPQDSVYTMGVYTIIWKKQADNSWKIALAQL